MNKDMELLSKLARLERLLHREQGRMHRKGHLMADTSRGQGRILAMLKIKEGISTKELSYLLGIRVSSLNETLAKMERNGYVSRRPSPEDKRISVIYLTEKGHNENLEHTEAPTVFDCFSEEEKDIFSGYLDRLIVELEARNPSEDLSRSNDERWKEMMKKRMGEEWYEHAMAVHGCRRSPESTEETAKRRRSNTGKADNRKE